MVQLRSCQRCRGDMAYGQDIYGDYLICIQCGHSIELALGTLRSLHQLSADQWGMESRRPKGAATAKQS
ncbi:MAG: hypothetical protein HW388_207 [Dehalococcoidia bacterium]|nr:hypothetical protein [Dehalococcoidia bacterium]